MSKRVLRIVASVLIIVALGLIVAGLQADASVVWLLGLACVAMAMVISLATRWIGSDPDIDPPS